MRKAGIRAALIEQRSCIVIHLDRREAGKTVRLSQDLITGLIEDRAYLRIVLMDRSDGAIQCDAVGPNGHRGGTPIFFDHGIVAIGAAALAGAKATVSKARGCENR